MLGKSIDSPDAEALIAGLGQQEVKTVVDRHYFEFHRHGLSLASDEGMMIETIFLYGREREGSERYTGAVPHGLSLDWDRRQVYPALGQPSAAGGGGEIPLYGPAAAWARYDFPTHSLHLEYNSDGQGIALVTLSTPEATPGRDSSSH